MKNPFNTFALLSAIALTIFLLIAVVNGQCNDCRTCPQRCPVRMAPAIVPTIALPPPLVVDVIPGQVIEVPVEVEVWANPAPVVVGPPVYYYPRRYYRPRFWFRRRW